MYISYDIFIIKSEIKTNLTSKNAKFLSWLICTASTGLLGAWERPASRIWALKNSAMDSWKRRWRPGTFFRDNLEKTLWSSLTVLVTQNNPCSFILCVWALSSPKRGWLILQAYLSHTKRNIANIQASGLPGHLTAHNGHLCGCDSHSTCAGGCQQCYCGDLASSWRWKKHV